MRYDRRDLRGMPSAVREKLNRRDGCWQELTAQEREDLLSGAHGSTSQIAAQRGLISLS